MVTLAEMMKVPLESVISGHPSFIPKIIHARKCKERNLVPLDKNKDRYGVTGEQGTARMYNLGNKHQGAVVGIYKKGYFNNVQKYDVSSMYPWIVVSWNLGPDTTSITNTFDFTGNYSVRRSGGDLVLRIPDQNFKRDVEITIDMTKEGFLKEEIKKLFTERKRLKKLESEAENKAEEEKYLSQQWAIKIILNSIYGIESSIHSAYGDMATGLTITGIGRWILQKAMDFAGESVWNCSRYRAGL
jgi:DNA polymerase elongation subunit (family B)